MLRTKCKFNFLKFVSDNVIIIGFIAISIIAFMLRKIFFEVQSADWYCFLSPWIQQLNEFEGLKGIGQEIGEYNVPYTLFLNIAAKTPFNDLYEVKLFSVFFDFICAFAAVICTTGFKKFFTPSGLLVWSFVLLSPISFLNSGFWSQCDSIWTSLIILSLFFLLKEKHILAMVFFAIAFAFKLQAVFFLPVIVIYYFASGKMRIYNFLIIPVIYFISILPAIFAGRSVTDTLGIYLKQTSLYSSLTLHCPNLYYLLNGDYVMFKNMGILLTLAILGTAACLFIYYKVTSHKAYILLTLWTSLVCVYFLPAMHERYSYSACIFAIIWMFVSKKDWWAALAVNTVSFLSWAPYLFDIEPVPFAYLSAVNLAVIVYLSYKMFHICRESSGSEFCPSDLICEKID